MPPFEVAEDAPSSTTFSLSLGVVLALSVSLFLIISCLTIAFHATKLRRFIRSKLKLKNEPPQSVESQSTDFAKKIIAFVCWVIDFIIGESDLKKSANGSGHSGTKWSKKLFLKNAHKSGLGWKLRFLDTSFGMFVVV
jgi:hypothetical protein